MELCFMDEKTIEFVKDVIDSLFGFVAIDTEGKIVLLGENYARGLGVRLEDAIGKPIEEVIANTEMLDVLKSGKSTWNKFYWAKSGVTGDRTPVPSLCTRLIVGRNGDTKDVVGVVGFGTITRSVDEGKLLVDGAKMANDTFKGIGWCAAFLIGWVLERRFVGFTTTDIPMVQRVSRTAVGLLSYYAVSLILVPLVKGWIGGPAGTMISCFIQMFYISFGFPWLCRHVLERSGAINTSAKK
jgi:hypothetical protein